MMSSRLETIGGLPLIRLDIPAAANPRERHNPAIRIMRRIECRGVTAMPIQNVISGSNVSGKSGSDGSRKKVPIPVAMKTGAQRNH